MGRGAPFSGETEVAAGALRGGHSRLYECVVKLHRRSRVWTAHRRGLRATAVLLGAVLIAATLTAGTRYAYCVAMGPLAGAHCACAAKRAVAARALTLQPTDCHRLFTVGRLPSARQAAAGASIPVLPRSTLLSSFSVHDFAFEPTDVLTAMARARQRDGPPRPIHADRTRRMVFLL